MKKIASAFAIFSILLSLCSCGGGKETSQQPTVDSSEQSSSGSQKAASQSADHPLSRYMTYRLPDTLADGGYNREMGSLGGDLFCRKDTGSCVAKEASEGTPPGWNSYGGAEIYYKLHCQFDNGQLTYVFLPWNHSIDLTKAEPVGNCETPAVIVRIGHDLYTAAEAEASKIDDADLTSTMWYVFFAKEDSDISYAVFLNADDYSKEDTISLAQSVKFKDGAFSIEVK